MKIRCSSVHRWLRHILYRKKFKYFLVFVVAFLYLCYYTTWLIQNQEPLYRDGYRIFALFGRPTVYTVNQNVACNISAEPLPKSLLHFHGSFQMVAQRSEKLQTCTAPETAADSRVHINFNATCMQDLVKLYPHLMSGGHSKPNKCIARHKVAIIVPHRNRDAQLRAFLHNLHGFLRNQQLDYAIFVVEQIANQTFNKGKLLNIGAVQSSKLYNSDCFIFHDVDLYPEDSRNLYSCPQMPRHLSAYIDRQNYRLLYAEMFGGVVAISRKQFYRVNGYSNDYWGWGAEDDDMSNRLIANGLEITRFPASISRYKMAGQPQERSNPTNPCRWAVLRSNKHMFRSDGLNSLKYAVKSVLLYPLYTKITVDLLENEGKQDLYKRNICRDGNTGMLDFVWNYLILPFSSSHPFICDCT